MSRPRSAQNLTHEVLDWLGSYPALLRMQSVGKPPGERAELAEIADGMARLHARIWNRWRKNQKEEREISSQ